MKKNIIRIISIFLSIIMLPAASTVFAAQADSFPDVPTNHWAYEYIERARENGWVEGYGDGTFRPEKAVSYAEWITMLNRVFLPEQEKDYDTYPEMEKWYYRQISISFDHYQDIDESKILTMNDPESNYDGWPKDCPRGNMANLAYFVLRDVLGIDGPNPMDVKGMDARFRDFDELYAGLNDFDKGVKMNEMWAGRYPGITNCVYFGILEGTSANRFSYQSSMTRAQAATVLSRMYDVVQEKNKKAEVDPYEVARLIVKYTNEEREKAGLEPLIWDDNLTEHSMVRAKEVKVDFSHTRPDGSHHSDGVIMPGPGGCGENLHRETELRGATRGDADFYAKLAVAGWMSSEGHKRNILNPNYTHIGAGCSDMYEGEMYVIGFVQTFFRPYD